MGVGAWAWGDKAYWGYDPSQESAAKDAFSKSLELGINLFDTAEVYGIGTEWGHSEILCGRFAREINAKGATSSISPEIIVATKFAPIPLRTSRESVLKALRESLERIGADKCDLYQLHWPSFFFDSQYWDGLADAYDAGLVRAVGVSNYSAKRLVAVHRALAARGVPLASNQVQYSLVHRNPERNGVRAACDDLGVRVLAYSPLGQGLLSGGYSKECLPGGPRGALFRDRFEQTAPLLSVMRAISESSGKTPAQVALNWCLCKGAIPIPGARNAKQAADNGGAMGWRLTADEVAALDEASAGIASSPGMPLADW
eukprot:CAMPEP_0172174562 /NCGR_PEP_ID=MMETSP1050-20130122/13738_1 /TAXON_ID=233186 /ORGANISM="Cryptomonas curvata, Strain CCAP979/52" /LENGTH=314 /DNA_ID=CAMNT_0012846561 /DNA_START=161 /DNA_END=1102 /DNA_ORIENTATION=+